MRIFRYFALIIFTTLFIQFTNGQTQSIKTVSNRPVKVADLDKLIQATMDSLHIPGVSIAIINNAEIVYHRAFGVKDISTKVPVDGETLFEGASLSKPLFAYFFMKMVDKGIVSLDEPMYKLLPHPSIKDNDVRYQLITPRMVLSHSTGFPNWAKDQPIPITFTPGTGFSYSGEAHQYLTAYLAVANKTNWKEGLESIFQKEVAAPLGMNHTYYIGNEFIKTHKATGYEGDSIKELWLPKAFGAAHTVHSEALDYAKFLQAMIIGKGLSENSMKEMLKEQNHFQKDNELLKTGQTGWCLGFSMQPTPNGMRYLHTGNNSGFTSYCCFYKEKKYGLVFFTNSEKAEAFYEKIGNYLDDQFILNKTNN
jgi:CubicO group peptidase (beta-lactamase class C family)